MLEIASGILIAAAVLFLLWWLSPILLSSAFWRFIGGAAVLLFFVGIFGIWKDSFVPRPKAAEASAETQIGGQTLYCPWADAVLKLTVSEDRKSVDLVSPLTNVPESKRYPAATRAKKIGAADINTVIFQEIGPNYIYRFELEDWKTGALMLWNERVRKSDGQTWRERGYCLTK